MATTAYLDDETEFWVKDINKITGTKTIASQVKQMAKEKYDRLTRKRK